MEDLDGKEIILFDADTGEMIEGGIVVNEERAMSTPCHGYDLGMGKKILWSKGVIGALSLPEQEKFCKVGMDIRPAPPKLAARIKALREAGVRFK